MTEVIVYSVAAVSAAIPAALICSIISKEIEVLRRRRRTDEHIASLNFRLNHEKNFMNNILEEIKFIKHVG